MDVNRREMSTGMFVCEKREMRKEIRNRKKKSPKRKEKWWR